MIVQGIGSASEATVVVRDLLRQVDDSAIELHAAMDAVYDAARAGGVVGYWSAAPVHLDAGAVRAALPGARDAAASLKDAVWGFYQLAQDNGFVHPMGRMLLGVDQLSSEIIEPWGRAVAVAQDGDTVLAHGPRNMYWKPVVSERVHGWMGGSRHEFSRDAAKASALELARGARTGAHGIADRTSRTEVRLISE